jgi:hypothetical protein
MSEYVLKIDNEPQAEALLTYLRSLDFVELLPKETSPLTKQEAVNGMTSFLLNLPSQDNYTQEEVDLALKDIRANRHDQ